MDGRRHFRLLDAGCGWKLTDWQHTWYTDAHSGQQGVPCPYRRGSPIYPPGFPDMSTLFSIGIADVRRLNNTGQSPFPISFGLSLTCSSEKWQQKSAGYKRILRFCAYLCSLVPVSTRHFNGFCVGFRRDGNKKAQNSLFF